MKVSAISTALNLVDNSLTDLFMRRLLIVLFVLNVISAAIFIGLVNRPVYDDKVNMYDVHNYATNGLSVNTVRSQRNAPGPTSFEWMAQFVRMLKGSELRSARLGALVTWVLLGVFVLVGTRWSDFPEAWDSALLVTLIFPHTLTAMGTVLTEGPALLFTLLGVMAWMCFARQPFPSRRNMLAGLLGGLCLGLAVTCRQYFLALLPAAAVFALLQGRGIPRKTKTLWSLNVSACLVVSLIPVVCLAWVWKGLSSPEMSLGQAYANLTVKVGLNFWRPIIAGFYVGFYLLLLTFPAAFQARVPKREWVMACAGVTGLFVAMFRSSIVQPGPLGSFLTGVARIPHASFLLFVIIVGATIYSVIALSFMAWTDRSHLFESSPFLFALLTVLFFVLEQLGVGGNSLFFERYMLQTAPFLGIIAFGLSPKVTVPRLLIFISLLTLSHGMLWRYALRG